MKKYFLCTLLIALCVTESKPVNPTTLKLLSAATFVGIFGYIYYRLTKPSPVTQSSTMTTSTETNTPTTPSSSPRPFHRETHKKTTLKMFIRIQNHEDKSKICSNIQEDLELFIRNCSGKKLDVTIATTSSGFIFNGPNTPENKSALLNIICEHNGCWFDYENQPHCLAEVV